MKQKKTFFSSHSWEICRQQQIEKKTVQCKKIKTYISICSMIIIKSKPFITVFINYVPISSCVTNKICKRYIQYYA